MPGSGVGFHHTPPMGQCLQSPSPQKKRKTGSIFRGGGRRAGGHTGTLGEGARAGGEGGGGYLRLLFTHMLLYSDSLPKPFLNDTHLHSSHCSAHMRVLQGTDGRTFPPDTPPSVPNHLLQPPNSHQHTQHQYAYKWAGDARQCAFTSTGPVAHAKAKLPTRCPAWAWPHFVSSITHPRGDILQHLLHPPLASRQPGETAFAAVQCSHVHGCTHVPPDTHDTHTHACRIVLISHQLQKKVQKQVTQTTDRLPRPVINRCTHQYTLSPHPSR